MLANCPKFGLKVQVRPCPCGLTGHSTRTPSGGPSLLSGPLRWSPVNSDVSPHKVMLRSLELKVAPLALAAVIAAGMGAWLWVSGLGPNLLWMRQLTVATLAGMSLYTIGCAVQNLLRAKALLKEPGASRTSYLVTEGAYSWSRNPMYLGILILLIALARAFDSFPAYLGPLLFFVLLDRILLPSEERELSKKFGGEYSDYMSKVRRWL
jgi:protein-S-isoprenylcysteine O-methyltransferase Ste14